MTSTFIYALKDPRDRAVRYVGKSDYPQGRLKSHVRRLNNPCSSYGKRQWIAELSSESLEPELVILEEVPEADWRTYEGKWITAYLAVGEPLLNIPTNQVIEELGLVQPVKRHENGPRRPWGSGGRL